LQALYSLEVLGTGLIILKELLWECTGGGEVDK
jgi:hypothetical protein